MIVAWRGRDKNENNDDDNNDDDNNDWNNNNIINNIIFKKNNATTFTAKKILLLTYVEFSLTERHLLLTQQVENDFFCAANAWQPDKKWKRGFPLRKESRKKRSA